MAGASDISATGVKGSIAGAPASAAGQTADTCVRGEVCFYSEYGLSSLTYSTPSSQWVSVPRVKSWRNFGYADSKPDVRIYIRYLRPKSDGQPGSVMFSAEECLKVGRSADLWTKYGSGVNVTRVQWVAFC